MNAEKIKQLETLLNRELSADEVERFRRIKDVLQISDQDALWDILTAMEYQRAFYDELPAKIAGASEEIFKGLSAAAEKEAAQAQSRLAESVVEQAKKISVRMNFAALLPVGLLTLICLLAYGSLMLWAGYGLGAGQIHSPAFLLQMPSGFLIGGLCIATGIFFGACAAKKFADGQGGWHKCMLAALVFLAPGGVIFTLAV